MKSTWWKAIWCNHLWKTQAVEPVVVRKANKSVTFRFGFVKLVDTLIFIGRAMRFDSFLKTYKMTDERLLPIDMVWSFKEAPILNYFLMKPLSTICGTANPLKRTIQNFKGFQTETWQPKRHLRIKNWVSRFQLRMKTTSFRRACGHTRKCAPPTTFYAGATTRRWSHFRGYAKNGHVLPHITTTDREIGVHKPAKYSKSSSSQVNTRKFSDLYRKLKKN